MTEPSETTTPSEPSDDSSQTDGGTVDDRVDDETDTVRVMTFNVRYDTAEDGDLAWPHRKEHVASVIRFHRPDVVGLQEPLEHQLDYLQEQLPAYDWVGVGRIDGETEGEHGPVGFRRDRFSLRDHNTFWLSETPHVTGSKHPEASYPRMATWVELHDERAGATFVACNTHFEHRSARAREESAHLLRRRLTDVAGDLPTVVVGDLNCTEDDPPYRVLTTVEGDGRRLYDAQYHAIYGHHGPTLTFNRFDGETKKIDYVFVTEGVSAVQHAVVADHWDGEPPSDHAPVVADVRFTN